MEYSRKKIVDTYGPCIFIVLGFIVFLCHQGIVSYPLILFTHGSFCLLSLKACGHKYLFHLLCNCSCTSPNYSGLSSSYPFFLQHQYLLLLWLMPIS